MNEHRTCIGEVFVEGILKVTLEKPGQFCVHGFSLLLKYARGEGLGPEFGCAIFSTAKKRDLF